MGVRIETLTITRSSHVTASGGVDRERSRLCKCTIFWNYLHWWTSFGLLRYQHECPKDCAYHETNLILRVRSPYFKKNEMNISGSAITRPHGTRPWIGEKAECGERTARRIQFRPSASLAISLGIPLSHRLRIRVPRGTDAPLIRSDEGSTFTFGDKDGGTRDSTINRCTQRSLCSQQQQQQCENRSYCQYVGC